MYVFALVCVCVCVCPSPKRFPSIQFTKEYNPRGGLFSHENLGPNNWVIYVLPWTFRCGVSNKKKTVPNNKTSFKAAFYLTRRKVRPFNVASFFLLSFFLCCWYVGAKWQVDHAVYDSCLPIGTMFVINLGQGMDGLYNTGLIIYIIFFGAFSVHQSGSMFVTLYW